MVWSSAAPSRTLKREFASDQTLEPTTVSGFAQFFDDFNRTDAWTAAAGVDFRATNNVWIGAEYLYRSLEIPLEAREGEERSFDRTDAWTAATGADLRVTNNLWIGAEYLYRDLEIPLEAREGEERSIVGYANAIMGSNLALSGSVEFVENSTEVSDRPANVRTIIVPVGARYFHKSGFFAAAEAVWVDQSAEALIGSDFEGA